MVGGTAHQPQQAPQLAPPSSSSAPAATPDEDEVLKRNTDCVYFLASPLTCKKGSECEYRHSDIARVNPRDCWYWLNGNCLNPKCGFRHPPLDGLLGADVSTPMGPPVAPAPHAMPYATPKQGVACIFFQKGFCLKGHLCPFLHGPSNSINNKAVQSGQANPVTEPPRMAYSGPEKSVQEQKFTKPETLQKPVEFVLPQGKQAPRMQPLPARNGGSGAINEKVPPPSSMGVDEPPSYKSSRVFPPHVVNEMPPSKSNHGVYQAYHVSDNDRILNGKDADEYSREPSPGFDVLVDTELEDSEYYHNDDEFGRSKGHDYDIGHPTDYDVDRDMYHEQRDYDLYNEQDSLQGGQYAWEDHRTSSETMLVGSAQLERKPYPRSDSPDHFDESDLRHRISEQRRGTGNSLRSVVSHEHAHERHADWTPRRDSHHHYREKGALSSRLRGRIKIPGRSTSPTKGNDSRMEREIDLGRKHQYRYSPIRPSSFNQSRLRDSVMGRVSKDNNDDARDYKGSSGRRDMVSDNSTNFSGPKRLSELKSGRSVEGYEQHMNDRQSLGKRKYPIVESRQSEDDLSFEGPKPLSEILKRKRGAETTALDSQVSSVNIQDNNKKEREIISESTVCTNKDEHKSVSANFAEAEKQNGSSNTRKDKSVDGSSSLKYDGNELGKEGGLINEDALLDQELEAYDHRDGDYDYEQIDGEDYNLHEDENHDDEYFDEEDGDDFAKKESVVYS